MSISISIPTTGYMLGVRLWTPVELAVLAWFDALRDSSITQVAGAVSQWDDRSGNDYHVLQATGADQPLTGGRTINGHNALEYDGANTELHRGIAGPYFRNVSSALVFVVAESDDTSGENIMIEARDNATATRVKTQIEGGYFSNAGRRLDSNSYQELDGPLADTDPHIYGSIYDYANAQTNWSLDGTLSTAQTFQSAGNTSDTNSTDLYIGGRGSSELFDGLIGEVILIENDITEVTRQRIEGYLAWRWGLVSNLPSGHPYKTNPPVVP